MDLRQKLLNKYISPSIASKNQSRTIGEVTYVGEMYCSVKYLNDRGMVDEKDNVPVLNAGTLNWFPKKKELVYIDVQEEELMIVGKYNDMKTISSTTDCTLSSDVYSTSYGGNATGGAIF